jgi:hypothetical protein
MMRSTSPPKSAWPGVSTMLIVTPPQCTEAFLALMVMPFSRSRSMAVHGALRRWPGFRVKAGRPSRSSLSTSVVLPWSTCAMMAILRNIRNARRLANGHYLVCHYGAQVVREYDAAGREVMSIPAAGGPHSAARLPDGHTLIACGDMKCESGPRVFEVDAAGKTVWEVKNGDLPGIQFAFMTGFQRLPNGNTVVSNWLGHGKFGTAPHILEITPDKKVVWSFADHKTMKTVSSVLLLDVPGDAIKGEILH